VNTDSDRELRLADLLERCLVQLREGVEPDRESLRAEHPELAGDLEQALDALGFVEEGNGRAESLAPEVRELGDFRIVREIGRGGMGVVYEAEQLSLGRRVALKVLPFAAVLDATQLQRFKNEAQAAAHLHHTNIVPVYGVGCERGVHYYAMPLIEGQTVAALVRDLRGLRGPSGPPSPPTSGAALRAITKGRTTQSPAFCRSVAELGIQVTLALDHAHQQGVVHRDIKPANLIVDAGGTVWITDFGLASFRTTASPGLTLTGDLLGTVRYMSPEQALAKRVPVDHRTDIYSLGVTLYELLTLEPAFPGDSPQQVLQEIAFREPQPPSRLNRAVPPELETILLKASAKDPEARYATAKELAEDFQRFLADKPILARRPSLLDRASKWARRHRALVAAAAAMLLLVTAGAVTSAVLIGKAKSDAERRRLAAVHNLAIARQAVDEMLASVGEEGLDNIPLMEAVRRDLLLKARKLYESLLAQNPFDRGLRLADLSLRWKLAQTYWTTGDAKSAESCYDAACTGMEALVREVPDDEVARDALVLALTTRGQLMMATFRMDDAERDIRHAVEECEKLRNPIALNVAQAWRCLAQVLQNRGDWHDAEEATQRALTVFDDLVRMLPAERVTQAQQAVAILVQTENLRHERRYDEAITLTRKVLASMDDLATRYPRDRRLREVAARAQSMIASDACALVDEKAEQELRLAVTRGEALARDFPMTPALLGDLAMDYGDLGRLLARTGREEESRQAHARVVKLVESIPESTRRGSVDAKTYDVYGYSLTALGRLQAAVAAFDQALALQPDDPQTHSDRATVLGYLGRHEEALAECDRAASLVGDARNSFSASVHCNRAIALRCLGRREEATRAYLRALEIVPDFPPALNALAWDMGIAADSDDAQRARAVEMAERVVRAVPGEGAYWNTLGVVRYRASDSKGAIQALTKSTELRSGGDPYDWLFLAMAHWQLGERDEARRWYDKSADWMESRKPDDPVLRGVRAEAARLIGASQ